MKLIAIDDEGAMRCPSCSRENGPDRRFCTNCGTPLEQPCSSCAAGNRAGAAFCSSCGAALATGATVTEVSDQSEPAAAGNGDSPVNRTRGGGPKLVTTRAALAALAAVVILQLAYALLYFSALWDPAGNIHRLKVALVNADAGSAGFQLGRQAQEGLLDARRNDKPLFDWQQVESVDAAREGVREGRYWAALVIPPTFSGGLVATVTGQPAQDHDLTFIADEGRNFQTVSLVRRVADGAVRQVSINVSTQLIRNPLGLAQADAAAVADPVRLREEVLHPVPRLGPNFASYLSFVVLWVGALTAVNAIVLTTARARGRFSPLRVATARVALAALFAAAEAIMITLVIRYAMGFSFTHGTLAFAAFAILATAAFIAVIGVLNVLLGQAAIVLATLLLILQLTASGAIFDTELMPGFFRAAGRLLPFTYAVEGARSIMFGNDSGRLPRAVVVLTIMALTCGIIAWLAAARRLSRHVHLSSEARTAVQSLASAQSAGGGAVA